MPQNLKHRASTVKHQHVCVSEINVEKHHTLVSPDVALIITAVLQEVGVTVWTLFCTLHRYTLCLHRECIYPKIYANTSTYQKNNAQL